MKLQEVINVFKSRLNQEVNFWVFSKGYKIAFFIVFLSLVPAFLDILLELQVHRDSLLRMAIIYLRLVIFRYTFYVLLINTLLDTLNTTLESSFEQNVQISKDVWKIRQQSFVTPQKVSAMRKVYKLIKEMEKIVNDTMGLLTLIQITSVALEMVNFTNTLKEFEWHDKVFYRKWVLKKIEMKTFKKSSF